MTQKEALALADYLVAQTKPKSTIIIPKHLRFDGWLSTARQLRKSILSTFNEMEQTKQTQHIQSLTILKLRISDRILRILPTLISFCSHATSIKLELEYPSTQSIEYELMHSRAAFHQNGNNQNDEDMDDLSTLMVTEQDTNKYFGQLFHTLLHLPNLQNLYLRFIDFPLSIYKNYISLCFDLKATNFKSFPALKSLTLPIDHNSIQIFYQSEYWQIFKHFMSEHKLSKFTLLLDGDSNNDNQENVQQIEQITHYFNHFLKVFLPTFYKRKYPLTSLNILAQSPINVLSKNDLCFSLICPFFSLDSIHLDSLKDFSLHLPNTPPYEQMLALIECINESKHNLIKFRLELPNDSRFGKKTQKLLKLLANFVNLTPDLIELHLHITSNVNGVGIKKLFDAVRNHSNLLVFEMGEMRMNEVTWNAMIRVFYCQNNGIWARCNSNLQLFKIHFCYKSWHKIVNNAKLNLTNDDPLRIIEAMYKNQQYLYAQIRVFEECMKEIWEFSMDIVEIMEMFVFNQSVFTLKIAGLSHEIKKKNMQCFNWFNQLMFNDVPIEEKETKSTQNQEELLHALDWNVLRSHVVKRQLVFR